MELRGIIAKNICALRTGAGLTQLQLAEILNYSDKAVSKWERGESVPDIFMLKRIADYFGVSVDYLLEARHPKREEPTCEPKAPLSKRSRAIISFLAATLVWLVATVVFVIFAIANPDAHAWLSFIYAIPLSAIVLLVFNSIWGRKRLNYLIISILVWTVIMAIYVSVSVLLGANIWLIFILGIPAEIIILLWSGMEIKRKSLPEEVGQ